MTAKHDQAIDIADRQIVFERTFEAPRDLVFAAWTDPEHITSWWGPRGFTCSTESMDVRPGGTWRFVLTGPDGTAYQNEVVYLEIEQPERLVYANSSGEADDPDRFDTTVTFAADGDRTHLTLSLLFATPEARARAIEQIGAIEGGNQTLDRLASHLVATTAVDDEGITMTRLFHAPRELVWRAWTEVEHCAQWFGERDSYIPLESASMEVRPGGRWSVVMIYGPERLELPFSGEYLEVVPPERLVLTLTDAGAPLAEVMTVTLRDVAGGRTEMLFTQRGTLGAEEYRRAAEGSATFFERLAEHLHAMRGDAF